MNDLQRTKELQAMRAEQGDLEARLASLEIRLARFELVETAASVPPLVAKTEPLPFAPLTPPSLPSLPPPLPLPLPVFAATLPLPPPKPEPIRQTAAPAVPPESLEMRIGTTWIARAGVVLLLTSLAFFGNYFYHHVVPHLGPAEKVALLYLGAGALAGGGAWLERSRAARASERLQNYARVVLAGGLAAVYYVTYAAHHFENLRVIASPLLAGGLLLGWSGFIVWLADRRGSETLATLAILLGFYTSAINEGVAGFTLFSNLALAAGAVFLLRRHLWRVFPFASLLATFGSYAFWGYFAHYEGGSAPGAPLLRLPGNFWLESAFLLVYWLLFTWAALTSDERVLPALRRAGFVTLNNGAFFGLVTWLLLGHAPGSFWTWPLGFGAVLLGLAEACRQRFRPSDGATENAYLSQGVLLVTLGFVSYFSDWQLSLVLAVQSAVLLWRAGERRSRLLLWASGAVAGLSFLYPLGRSLYETAVPGAWAAGLAEGAFLLGNAWWSQRLLDRARSGVPPERNAAFGPDLALAPNGFAALGTLTWLCLIGRQVTDPATAVLLLAGGAALLTASFHLLRVRALPGWGQVYLTLAHFGWLAAFAYPSPYYLDALPAAWTPLLLLAVTLALGHWWQWRRTADGPLRHEGRGFVVWDALLAVTFLYQWLHPHAPGGEAVWTAELAGLSLAVLVYGVATRYRALAAAGQGLLAASVGWFFVLGQSGRMQPGEPWLALTPLLVVLLVLLADARLGLTRKGQAVVERLRTGYELAAIGLFLCWGARYVPRQDLFTLNCVAGGVVFVLGVWRRERRYLVWSGVLTAAAVLTFGLVYDAGERRHWLNLLGVVVLVSEQQFGRRRLSGEDRAAFFPPRAQGALMTAATLCAWTMAGSWAKVLWPESGFALPVSWSLFAPLVFGLGLALHEKVYRWLGLVVVGATLAHGVVFDLWQLDALGRAVSALCLGLAALGIGFLYNRFHAKFRELF